MKVDHITINQWSRPGDNLKEVKGIVVHWVANPMTSAKANRDYFEMKSNGTHGYGSTQYIIGIHGEVIQCMPEDETAYHVGARTYTEKALGELSHYPNNCTIGIECCHVDRTGVMTTETYFSLIELITGLCKKYNLNADNLYLHYDITGKDCHKWFVNNPDEWQKLKDMIEELL